MNHRKLIIRSMALGAVLVGSSTHAMAQGLTCGDPVDCATDQDGPFTQQPAANSTGLIEPAQSPALFPVSVAQFDAVAAASMHDGASVADIDLKRAEVTLELRVDSFDLTEQNTSNSPPTDCQYELTYTVDLRILANPVVGTGELAAPPLAFDVPPTVISPGDTLMLDLGDFPGNELPVSSCTAGAGDLSAWIGSGDITWQVQVVAVSNQVNCPQGLSSVTSTVEGTVLVKYSYCVETIDCPDGDCGEPLPCVEGCTPGYWKNHLERWDGQGGDDFTSTVTATDSFNAAFGVTEAQSGFADSVSLIDATGTGGGGLDALGRHAAAALASSDTAILYPYDTATVISIYRDGVGADPGPETVESAKDLLESANEAGCPLSNDYEGAKVCPYCDGNEANDCPCGAPAGPGGCLNSTGQGALLQASGSSKYGADDLVLSASGLPGSVSCIWIAAPAQQRVVLGDGLLCLANGPGKIVRRQMGLTTPQGTSQFGPGIVAGSFTHPVPLAAIAPGDTRYFQLHYRDPASTCGGDANLSNALGVTFYP